MKLLRAMFVIAFSLSVVATASARHADGDTNRVRHAKKSTIISIA